MLRGCKIRLYPTKEQEQKIWNHIHAARFIWNYMLAIQNEKLEKKEKFLTGYQMANLIKPLKNCEQYLWLKNVSNTTLKEVCVDLGNSFHLAISKKTKYPKFKSRKKQEYRFPTRSDFIRFENNFIVIEKIGKIKYKSDILFKKQNQKYYNVRMFYEDGKYFVSVNYEREKQTQVLTDCSMGVDVGIKNLATVVCDKDVFIYNNINKSEKIKKLEKRASRIRKIITRKYNHCYKQTCNYLKSNNINKLEIKYKKITRKIRNIKRNNYHHVTKNIVEKYPQRIVVENLVISEMTKNKEMHKRIQKQNFCTFFDFLKYKSNDNGINYVLADKYFPSSKMCSYCGEIKKDLKLSDRVYVCDNCGQSIDRDINAARNLMMYQN